MIISQDLRAAIRSAEKAQPKTDWAARDQQQRDSIAAMMKKYPAKGRTINALVKAIKDAETKAGQARKQLCEKFGIRASTNRDQPAFEFAGCDNSREIFLKAGGVLPVKPAERWKFDSVMSELAAADPKQAEKILKRCGINWK